MPILRAAKPRHAKPSAAAPVLAVGGLTATLGAAGAGTAAAASADDFARLRACESGGNYSTNTGNGFYGAYQFDVRTWRGLGYSGLPSSASPGTQDAAAQRLQAQRGWQPWPACSRKLGLGSGNRSVVGRAELRASRSTTRPVLVSRPAVRAVRPTTAPAFTEPLTTAMVATNRHDVRQWQHRMAARGWDLVVDGKFGPRTAAVAARFAAEKGMEVTPGTVDRALWVAAWEVPVS